MQLAAFCADADAVAKKTQRAFLRMHLIQLTLILTAALVGVFPLKTTDPPVDWSGVAAATLFGATLLMRVLMVQRKDADTWYSARQASEVSKSLCYRFAFGATGFERTSPTVDAERRFLDAFTNLGANIVVTPSSTNADRFSVITDDMRATRALPFLELKDRYLSSRIREQQEWYSAKAAYHLQRSHRWLALMLAAEVGGLLFGILKAAMVLPESTGGLIGLMSALAAAFLAWSQLRQHSILADTYQKESVALRDFGHRLSFVEEDEWPAFVAAAEDSIGAEHTRWQGLLSFVR